MFCEQEIIMSYRAAQAFQVQAVWKQQWADTILTLVIQESRCLEQLPTKSKRAHCFSISLFISMLQKICNKNVPNDVLIILFYSQLGSFSSDPQLGKITKHTFPMLWIWNPPLSSERLNNRQKMIKEKSMPKLIKMNLVITALEYLYTTEEPFNFWNVYVDRQLLLWQNR